MDVTVSARVRFAALLLAVSVSLGFAAGAMNDDLGVEEKGGSHPVPAAGVAMSDETESCIDCHTTVTPGIVADWARSRHAAAPAAAGLGKPVLQRRVSATELPAHLSGVAVGCAECHTLNPGSHEDSFDHGGCQVHVVVTPADCATCHPIETEEYSENLMSYAYVNLAENTLYRQLVGSAVGMQHFDGLALSTDEPGRDTEAESCFYCHGTKIEVGESTPRETIMGTMDFPELSGWPSQGVGRMNPDGTRGSCAACHARHRFSIAMARKPATCSGCHKGPDVPAYNVYSVSKHGNIYNSLGAEWDFTDVPWVVGDDFSAPTCAACHVSLITTEDGEVVAPRTHKMSDRLAWRIFGLPYAHPQPQVANTTVIRNAAGLSLPTELTGEPAQAYLIDEAEMARRRGRMSGICHACHTTSWIEGQFAHHEHTIAETNEMTLTATEILLHAWEQGLAQGPEQGGQVFDEAIEKMWIEQWLFFANSTRFASAMGGADYGAFANGRWYLSKNARQMLDWVKVRAEPEEVR